MRSKYIFVFAFLVAARAIPAQETPVEVSACELAKNPGSFDKKMIRVRAGLSVHFEDFSLRTPDCAGQNGVWLAFGGDVPGIVTSMANDNVRKPGTDITVEGVPYGIKKDENFRRLYALIAAGGEEHPKYRVTATLTGRFFAGLEQKLPDNKTYYGGYGHLGCCSLFVIMEVSGVESNPPANLSLHGTVSGPDGKPMEGLTVIDDILGGSPPERQQVLTNAKGEFMFAISGEQLRIEDPRYRPVALSVEPGGPAARIMLEDARLSDWHIPGCADNDLAHRIGFSVLFRIPPTMDSSLNEFEDGKGYFVFPRGKDAPEAELIISSFIDNRIDEVDSPAKEQFQQRWVKGEDGKIVGIDSRGWEPAHGGWRDVHFYQSRVSYSFHKPKPHKALDQIIDSACIAKK